MIRVTHAPNAHLEQTLAELRADLLRDRPPSLRPDEGRAALQHHTLLTAAIHRAAKLDQRGSESETDAWIRYVVNHFPSGRNNATDARLLFGDWRTSLLKAGAPGPGVSVTHGQSVLHWQRNDQGLLCLNLEDAWDDFAASVGSFVAELRTSTRREVVLKRWNRQRVVVRPFASTIAALAGATAMDSALSTSVAQSATTVNLSPAPSVTANADGRRTRTLRNRRSSNL